MQNTPPTQSETPHFVHPSAMDLPRIFSANPPAGTRGDIHVYLPAGCGPHPVVLGVHGGGWHSGDQQSYAWLWPRLKPLGVALVLPSYRLAPASPFPQAYDDLMQVLRWIRRHGRSRELDPERCLLLGGSAGGHLAMLLGTRGTAEREDIPTLRGVAAFCGIMDLEAQYHMDLRHNRTMTRDFLQRDPAEDPTIYRQASPVAHIHPAMPPVWLAHGAEDLVVSPDQSRDLVKRLKAAGHTPIHREAKGLGHTMVEKMVPPGVRSDPGKILFEKDFLDFLRKTLLSQEKDIASGDDPA